MERKTKDQIKQDELEKQVAYISQLKELNAGKLKKFVLTTYGCQMNENDSERLSGFLTEMGYVEAQDYKDADLVIFNTCCVRENAEQKVYGHLGALKKYKEVKPDLIIAVCGCMMQQKHVVEHITKVYRHVGIIFGTHNLYRFPEILYKAINSDSPVVDVWEQEGRITEGLPIVRAHDVKAWVTIMYGCNNFCSYCIVPYVRGRERSRKVADIVAEARGLADSGFKEITLLGQNVNSYKGDAGDQDFAYLLEKLGYVDGIERIRFMTSHPKDLSDRLIYAMRDIDKVCEHLHLPIQSGSTEILKKMNRKYTREKYLELVEKIRDNIPGIALTTDVIVGFPGETEEDFEHTMDVIEKVRFDSAYTFIFSKRTGTPAAKAANQVPEEIKKERFNRLLNAQNVISHEINEKLNGAVLEVLVEGASRNNPAALTGRTRTNKIVNFKGSNDLIGKLVNVKINKIQTWSLEGEII
ncbi:MAG TPA: tRNA (N6-isopentenyl adenosine(37)-C2)-methylthiotransferase MiaB [Clostridiaceae bacterium]|jgi:tRNA-2-methylthio-N6-dimethylallyladenosine synthase|nr:tRNA (N6-isopentenyl adenosine(37)-C2)-methylthiotransferase MiaB [Clostridiaceae bacterium]